MKTENRRLYIVLIVVLVVILILISIFVANSAIATQNNTNSNGDNSTINNTNNSEDENDNILGDEDNNESEGEEYRIENYENKNGDFVYVCQKIVDSNDWAIDIPCINSNNENIQKINKKVYNEIVELSAAFEKTDNNIYYNDNVVSYVVLLSGFITDGADKEYMVFNFNKETLENIGNEELLTSKNIKDEDIINEYNELLKTSFVSEIKEYSKLSDIKEEDILNNISNSKLETTKDLKLFLDNNGKLNVVLEAHLSETHTAVKVVSTKF